MRNTHIVLDTHYTPDEGQECFYGTIDECIEFINLQGGVSFMYKVVEMTIDEYKYHNEL